MIIIIHAHDASFFSIIPKVILEKFMLTRRAFQPGIGVHQCGCGLPLGCSSLEDLIDLILVMYRYLLQALNNNPSLRKKNKTICKSASRA